MTAYGLSKEEVSRLVYSYQDEAVTDELYQFGMVLMSEIQDRADRINSQSTIVLGWATAILALLLTQSNKFGGGGMYFALVAEVSTILAVIAAFCAGRTRGNWSWPSDSSWIRESALVSKDEMMRYHIRVMHDVRQQHLRITKKKARCLFYSELLLVLGAIALFAGIGYQMLFPRLPGLLALAKSIQIGIVSA